MLNPIKKRMGNLVDGNKISITHLQQIEGNYADTIRDFNIDSERFTNFNYGLLPPNKGEKSSCDLRIKEKIGDKIEIELKQCNAITSRGGRIDIKSINHSDSARLDHDFSQEIEDNKQWNVVLVLEPFYNKHQSIVNAQETSPNYKQTYDLFIQPIGQIPEDEFGIYHLIVGRIIKKDNNYSIDSNYIPPSVMMNSHPDLEKYYELFGKYLNEIEISSQSIIQKIQDKDNNSDLTNNMKLLCEKILIYIAEIRFNYINRGRFYQPIEIAYIFSAFARVCFFLIDSISLEKKNELLNYFYKCGGIEPNTFLELLSNLEECGYDHQDIRCSMARIESSLALFSGLWSKI